MYLARHLPTTFGARPLMLGTGTCAASAKSTSIVEAYGEICVDRFTIINVLKNHRVNRSKMMTIYSDFKGCAARRPETQHFFPNPSHCKRRPLHTHAQTRARRERRHRPPPIRSRQQLEQHQPVAAETGGVCVCICPSLKRVCTAVSNAFLLFYSS